ncbi:hypothetical protein V1477_008535 [Vespula maculifrons]|uniref:Uncharacterized protein n=1 Tax=Vespula maculifrons TaxID=7453 RepID=A0ABD2CDA8_VESMC
MFHISPGHAYTSVLKPSQNFLNNTTSRVSRCLKLMVSDGRAFCKRDLTHFLLAKKLKAREAESFHLGTHTVNPWVFRCSNFHTVRPESVVFATYRNLMKCKYYRTNGCTNEIFQDISKIF